MVETSTIREVFVGRATIYSSYPDRCRQNCFGSPIFDILSAADRLGLLSTVYKMINGSIALHSKPSWSKLVWSRAWKLEDAYWMSTFVINIDCEYMFRTSGKTKYITWWLVSDKYPSEIRMCENLAKIVCKTSKLKVDDYRLKHLSHSHRTCSQCDSFAVEDIEHIFMQCPAFDDIRRDMYNNFAGLKPSIQSAINNQPSKVFIWCLGGQIEGVRTEDMFDFWMISGNAINNMYRRTVKGRDGIG